MVFDRINMIYKILCLFDIDRIRCGKMLPVVSDTEAAVPDTIPAMSKGRHKRTERRRQSLQPL